MGFAFTRFDFARKLDDETLLCLNLSFCTRELLKFRLNCRGGDSKFKRSVVFTTIHETLDLSVPLLMHNVSVPRTWTLRQLAC